MDKTESNASFLSFFLKRGEEFDEGWDEPADFDLVYLSEYCLGRGSCAGPNSRLGHNLGLAEPTRAILRWYIGPSLFMVATLALPCSLDGRMRLVFEVKAGEEKPEEVEELETEVEVGGCLGCFPSCDFGGWENELSLLASMWGRDDIDSTSGSFQR